MRDKVIVYRSFFEAVKNLDKKIAGEIFVAICQYGLDGTEPDGLGNTARGMFTLIRPQIDANIKRYDNGKKTAANKVLKPYTDEFDEAWTAYEKRGDKKQAFKEWEKLTPIERMLIKRHIPTYCACTPEIRFRKHFQRYLSNRVWEEPEQSSYNNETQSGKEVNSGKIEW